MNLLNISALANDYAVGKVELSTVPMSNTTEDDSDVFIASDEMILLYNILVILQVCVLMLSMGSGTELAEIKGYILRPIGPIVGVICQLFLMPFLTFAFAQALQVEADLAIGMVLVSSCPGGAPANFFTLISRGNLSLSVCLTVFSSVLALGTMPLNKIIYIRSWSDELPIIPYTNIVIGILTTWIPAMVGIFIKHKWPKIGGKLTRIGGVIAFLILIAFAIVQQFVYPGVFQLQWGVWFAAIFLPTFGWIMGFGVATMFLFKIPERRAIAYATSYVNGGLALALITISFGKTPEASEYIMFPMLYTASQLVMAIVIGVLHLWFFRMKEGTTICQILYRKCSGDNSENGCCVEAPQEQDFAGNDTEKHYLSNGVNTKTKSDENGNIIALCDTTRDNKLCSTKADLQAPPPYNSCQLNKDVSNSQLNRDILTIYM